MQLSLKIYQKQSKSLNSKISNVFELENILKLMEITKFKILVETKIIELKYTNRIWKPLKKRKNNANLTNKKQKIHGSNKE